MRLYEDILRRRWDGASAAGDACNADGAGAAGNSCSADGAGDTDGVVGLGMQGFQITFLTFFRVFNYFQVRELRINKNCFI